MTQGVESEPVVAVHMIRAADATTWLPCPLRGAIRDTGLAQVLVVRYSEGSTWLAVWSRAHHLRSSSTPRSIHDRVGMLCPHRVHATYWLRHTDAALVRVLQKTKLLGEMMDALDKVQAHLIVIQRFKIPFVEIQVHLHLLDIA